MSDLSVLSADEVARLGEFESRIERGLKTFVEVGTALAEIRDSRLYRAEHATFEAYCRERWGFSDRRASQFIEAASVVPKILGEGLPAPAVESQAREIAKVPEPERAEVWQETIDRTEGRPTAAAVREVVRERAAEPSGPPVFVEPVSYSMADRHGTVHTAKTAEEMLAAKRAGDQAAPPLRFPEPTPQEAEDRLRAEEVARDVRRVQMVLEGWATVRVLFLHDSDPEHAARVRSGLSQPFTEALDSLISDIKEQR